MAVSTAVERSLKPPVWPIRHGRSEGQAQCLEGEPRKREEMSALRRVGLPNSLSVYTQGAFFRPLGSACLPAMRGESGMWEPGCRCVSSSNVRVSTQSAFFVGGVSFEKPCCNSLKGTQRLAIALETLEDILSLFSTRLGELSERVDVAFAR